jgi:DNA-binding GntR family transcriptional regulator
LRLPSADRSKKCPVPIRKRVYDDLRNAILSGRLNPAERLTEEHLAETLGVSRTPVREALYKLESEGLIEPLETRGFIVSTDSIEEVKELFEIRAILEGYTLRVISQKITARDIEQLGGIIEKAEDAFERRQMSEVFEWNTLFHDTLHGMVAEKRQLCRLIVSMRENVLRYRRDTLHSRAGAKRTIEGHKKILLALGLKDPDLCEKTMRGHINQAKEDALCTLNHQGLGQSSRDDREKQIDAAGKANTHRSDSEERGD